MKHCSQRPPNIVSVALPGTTTDTVALPGTTTDRAALPGTTTDTVAMPGTTTDIVDLPGTTDPVALPGRRLSVSLNSVQSQDNHQVRFILLCNSRFLNILF